VELGSEERVSDVDESHDLEFNGGAVHFMDLDECVERWESRRVVGSRLNRGDIAEEIVDVRVVAVELCIGEKG
jgi:hypothetical protein